jgi:hypothetical protein
MTQICHSFRLTHRTAFHRFVDDKTNGSGYRLLDKVVEGLPGYTILRALRTDLNDISR